MPRLTRRLGYANLPAVASTQRRYGARRILVVSHRWVALIIGVLLVVISTSGALVVYEPELLRASHPQLYHSTPAPNPIGFSAAIDAVAGADPEFAVADVSFKDGVYQLADADGSGQVYYVDSGTGSVNGHVNPYGGVLGLVENLHDCGLTCEGYLGYQSWLAEPTPFAGWAPLADMTWGSTLLAVAALAMIFLTISAPIIWWPGIRKLAGRFKVRWQRGRFARDFDLHNVIGIVAVAPLLIWGLTGLNFEVPGFTQAWYSITGGQAPPSDNGTLEPSEVPGPELSVDDAVAVALRHFPGAQVTWVGLPEDESGFYSIDLLDGGPDLWAHNAAYHGNRSIGIDAHDGDNVRVFLGPSQTVSNAIADEWAQPALHYGHAVNPYWRTFWFGLGMTPLLLLLTGISTWLYRRGVRRRRAATAVGSNPVAG